MVVFLGAWAAVLPAQQTQTAPTDWPQGAAQPAAKAQPAATAPATGPAAGALILSSGHVEVQLRGGRFWVQAQADTPAGKCVLERSEGKLTSKGLSVNLERVRFDFAGPDEYGPFWDALLADLRAQGSAEASGSVNVSWAGQGPPVVLDLLAQARLPAVVWHRPNPLEFTEVSVGDLHITEQGLSSPSVLATAYEGFMRSSFAVDYPGGDIVRYRIDSSLEQVDLARLAEALTGTPGDSQGGITGRVVVQGSQRGYPDFTGRGVMVLNNANLWNVPVVSAILEFMPTGGVLTFSDGQARFTIDGGVVTIRQAQIASSISAMEVEPGGTVDLASGMLNFYVVGVPLSEARSLLTRIPLVKLLVDIKDRITRLHVEGHWSKPPSELIEKESVQDLAAGTLDFFKDAAQTGGQIGGKLLGSIGDLFESLD